MPMHDVYSYYRSIDPETRLVVLQVLRIAGILLAAWVLQAVAARFIRLFRAYMERRTGGEELARVDTLARVFRNSAAVLIAVVAGTLILGELGISIAPILATAGVAGIAIGFGAQSLIKDHFNGIFLLIDDQVRVGDVVAVGGKDGYVEEVTLRYVRLRNWYGHVHYVPNGEITTVTNMTREFGMAVIEARLAYREDVERALGVMREVGEALRADPAWSERLAAEPEMIGVARLEDSAVIVSCRMKVVPAIQQWNVTREFLKRLKKAYGERGIEIAFPHLTVYPPQAKDGSAPALRVVTQSA
jgi:small conductance mechanosensitive channel